MTDRQKIITTLCMVYEHPRILLGMKKRGFGEGRWNGFGGKVKDGESIEESAKRELFEECGVKAGEVEKFGVMNFDFIDKGRSDPIEMHVFHIKSFFGEPRESEEMKPQWFFIDEIPFTEMWESDLQWFPYFLSGKKVDGNFLFDKGDRVKEKKIIIAH